jgi:HK97 family phage prohead protease
VRHKLLDQAAFHRLAQAGTAPAAAVQHVSDTRGRVVDEARRAIRFCYSDDSIDRMGDRIFATGWELEEFKRNSVALFAHDSAQPPIGRATNVQVEGSRLMGDIEFMAADLYPFADLVYRMAKDGWINAVSVGFLPLEWERSNDPARAGGLDFRRQSLLEISAVPVPANSNALTAAKRMGGRPAQLAQLRRGALFDDDAAGDDDEPPLPDCGRDPDEPCGLIDFSEC